jgi:hypothetical protein
VISVKKKSTIKEYQFGYTHQIITVINAGLIKNHGQRYINPVKFDNYPAV